MIPTGARMRVGRFPDLRYNKVDGGMDSPFSVWARTMSEGSKDSADTTVPGRLVRMVALLWGLALFSSILFAGLELRLTFAGRLILSLIAVGFLLFTIARASAGEALDRPEAKWSCARVLTPQMRAAYYAGYLLMSAGVALTAAAWLTGIRG